MRRLLLIAVLVVAAGVPAAAAGAQDDPTTTSTLAELPPADIIPRPNSGTAPQEAGDRGGALQLGLLALVVGVLAGGVLFVVHQSRRARAERDA